MEPLTGNFLIATSRMPDPRFQRQVVFICGHSDDEGAMGIVINHPTPHTLSEVLEGARIPVPEIALPPIYLGGPVEMESGFFLFTGDFECPNFIQVTPNIRLSRDVEILWEISRSHEPEKYLFALGYAGWSPGQLEQELVDDGWLALPGDEEIIFDTPDERKWEKAALQLGVDIETYGDAVGSA